MPEQAPGFEGQCAQGGPAGQSPVGRPRPTVDRFMLANGLEVWHEARPQSGTVSIVLVVRVGARYETRHNNGISHFLEHMLFDGTDRWNEVELKEVVRRKGGYFNAQTDYEYTAYEVHLLGEDLELALDWLAEIVFRSTLPTDKVERERQVLMQEKGGRSSRLMNVLEAWGLGYDLGLAVRQRLFPGSALGLRVCGEDEPLARIRREDLLAYHRLHYQPNNMALVVVGDADGQRVRAATERYFAGFPDHPAPGMPAAPETPRGGIEINLRGPNVSDRSYLRLGARTVGAGHSDAAPLEVLAELLSNRLTEEVRLRYGLVYAIGAYNVTLSDAGYFAVRTESDAQQMDAIQGLVQRHLQTLAAEPAPEVELQAAIAALQGQFALSTQSNPSLAWLYADDAVWCRPGLAAPDHWARLRQVTAQEVQRVVRRYFTPANSYLGLYRPAFTLRTGLLSTAAGLALLAAGAVLWRRVR